MRHCCPLPRVDPLDLVGNRMVDRVARGTGKPERAVVVAVAGPEVEVMSGIWGPG